MQSSVPINQRHHIMTSIAQYHLFQSINTTTSGQALQSVICSNLSTPHIKTSIAQCHLFQSINATTS
jgi:hypothetical protein